MAGKPPSFAGRLRGYRTLRVLTLPWKSPLVLHSLVLRHHPKALRLDHYDTQSKQGARP